MNQAPFLTVRREHLSRLNSRDAELFTRDLLWEEARRLGSGICDVKGPSETNAPDGKVDITVDASPSVKESTIIAPGRNSYQVKSGKEFKPWLKSAIEAELFDKDSGSEHNLGEGIRTCLDADGTYVLVCTGIHLSNSRIREACSHIQKFLEGYSRREPKVKVWDQGDLIEFLQEFPLLVLKLTGLQDARFQTHDKWARNDDMRRQFVVGPQQQVDIENIRHELHRDDRPVHLRVWGEPGIGKTKLVFEATKVKYLSHLVVYYSTVSRFESCVAMNEIRFDENLSAIVVIDECDPDSRARIWNHMYQLGPRIKLVTIYNDYEDRAGDISYFNTTPLDSEHIRSIIENYHIPTDVAMRYTEFCSGSPRVAHVIGQNLLNHPEDLLKPPAAVNIWDRYVVGNSDPNSLEVKERKRTLRYIALFKRFGYRKPVGGEAKIIAQMAKIDWERFQEIVHELKNRRILQGETTLYITPKALHIKLWAEWWENYGDGFDLEEFKQGLTPKLVEWFYEMFQYAFESGVASEIAKRLLGIEGPFRNGEYLKTWVGSRFFVALTEGDPQSALGCLLKTVGNWDKETLLQFGEGRRNIVWALEKIAVWRDLFADAARLLLALAEAENEGFSNNASGVFTELFSSGPGRVAPTEAPLSTRLPILEEAFASDSEERRALALRACNVALESTQFSRIGSPEYQGLRQQPDLWTPTHGEICDAYKKVWGLLDNQLDRLPDDESIECAMILLGRAQEISQIPDLAEMVVETISAIAEKKYVNHKHVIESVSQILRYDSGDISAETQGLWEQLMDKLVTRDFHSMMKRYVGMDLSEDEFDEEGNYVDQAQPQIEDLAKRALDDVNLLQSELDWLVTTEAQKGYHFGHELGKSDREFSLLQTLLNAQRNAGEDASAYFLGGYLRALFETDPSLWEVQLDALIDDAELRLLIPELTYRSGLTDRAGLRFLELAKDRIISAKHFGFFAYGQAINNLSNDVFTEWLTFLLSDTDKSSVALALNFFHRYHVFQKPKPTLPFELTFRLITHPALFKEIGASRSDTTMTAYYWAEISRTFLQLYPEKNLDLAELMLSHFGEDGSIVGPYSQTCSVLDELMQKYPSEVWKQTSRLLEGQENTLRTIALEQWLREGSSWGREESTAALLRLRYELIWKWIDKDIQNHAGYFAYRLVPKTYSSEEWMDSLVRAFLVRYGSRKEVRSSLISNYMSGTWLGPPSVHYQSMRDKLLRIKDIEDDENVKRWIDEFAVGLKAQVEQERMREEREH